MLIQNHNCSCKASQFRWLSQLFKNKVVETWKQTKIKQSRTGCNILGVFMLSFFLKKFNILRKGHHESFCPNVSSLK